MPVLLLLLLGTIEMGMRVYYKAQVRSAATAAVLASVGTQVHWPITIPTEWVVVPPAIPIPVDGIVINTLHLPNVDWPGDVRGEALETRKLTNPDIKFDTLVLPWALAPSPLKWVRITASVSPPQVFSRIFGAGELVESACAIAWIRPDYWEHGWWTEKSEKSLFGIGDWTYRYYRLVPCSPLGVGDSLEAIITEYVKDTGDGKVVKWDPKFEGQIPHPDPGSGLPPPRKPGPANSAEVNTCATDLTNCRKQEAQPYTCSTDGKTTFTVEPQRYKEGETPRTIAQLEAEHCPPPPPPQDEKKEGNP